MKRLLLLLPTRGYRAPPFMEVAARLGVDLTVASEEPSTLEGLSPGSLLTLDFAHPDRAAQGTAAFAREYPIHAVVGVDDATTGLQAAISEALGIQANSYAATATARNKLRMREALRAGGMDRPTFSHFSIDDDPSDSADQVPYPCVLKPLALAGSRGVIRANNPQEFETAFRRIAAILREPEVASAGADARQILVESYLPGVEVALEGIVLDGRLQVLAIFDKPDRLDGPFFEETIYTTPSRLAESDQQVIAAVVARAASILELWEGPVHAEIRLTPDGPVILEVNPRSIGGKCSRILRFGAGMTLEEIILRRALRMEIPSMKREEQAAGVMMIPIPGAGVLKGISGLEAAGAVPGIEEVSLSARVGQRLTPLPEGSVYLGFIFARGPSPDRVEDALRAAHRELKFRLG
ncbi:MAG TPA: ATP-grasp domain-containing protein [Armatimonadota bacterium]|nr:ATP-grasp domain-containing protein [Armatimonadota bacterium]